MTTRTPLWKKALLSAVSLGVTVGLLEGGARAWDYAQYGTVRVEGQPVGLYIRDGNPEPRLQPNAHLNGLAYSISVNSRGQRDPERAVPKPRGTVRVWCVGGSTTFDIYASDNHHTWPAVAEKRLSELLPGGHVELINGGVPGDILEGSGKKLAAHGRTLGVDYVLIYHGANDIRAVSGGHFAVHAGPRLPFRSLDLLRDWAVARGMGTGSLPDRAPTRDDRRRLENRLRFLERQVHALNATPIYATHAARMSPDSSGADLRMQAGELPAQLQMSPASARQWYDLWNELMTTRARSVSSPLVDVRAAVGSDRALWGDATHFSDAGAEVAGAAVAEALAPYLSSPH